MKLQSLSKLGLLAASAIVAVGLAASPAVAQGQQKSARGVKSIQIDGSSTVFPIAEAVAEEFQGKQGGKVRVTVGESGTGGGFRKFCVGSTDISNASRPILAKEMKTCRDNGVAYIELPVAFDALTVVVHPSSSVNSMTIAELKKMWSPESQGKVTKWNQVNPAWQNADFRLLSPGTASGTFDYFTEAVNGKAKSSRTDFIPSEDDNVLVQGVAGDVNAISYFGLAYYTENKGKIKAVAIDGGKGPVLPSMETVENGTYNPLARPIFIYVNAASAKRAEVKAFVNYWLDNGAKYAKEVGYVGLPASAYTTGKDRLAKGMKGTAFAGKNDVGASITEVLSRKLVIDAAPE